METILNSSVFAEDWNKTLVLDDLISPRKKITVPNHLLDTKIFSRLKENDLIKVDPPVIHFGGYDLHKTQQRSFKICNSSSDRQNLHIISPATKYFSVKYTKPRRFVPGFTIDVVVRFTPDEWRYYYDCIRLHCEGEENIIIPLHAYPVMDLSDLPKKIVFDAGGSKLGETRKKLLQLKSPCPVDFEYQIIVSQSHPALSVEPLLTGTVPGEGETSIAVIYKPTEYVTSHMTLQLNISQFNAQPILCFVTASCTPKNANKMRQSIKDYDEMYKKTKVFDPRSLSLVQMSRKRKTVTTVQSIPMNEIEYDGLHFPTKLHTQHAVNSVLLQKAGKLRAKDVREAAMSKLTQGQESSLSLTQSSSRQMKEATFKQQLRKDEIEERANHLRWQVRLGDNALDDENRLQILRERQRAQNDYKYKRRCEPDEDAEVLRTSTHKTFRRTFRNAEQIPREIPTFDLYKNNPWLNRHRALERFQQAARTILIRQRADKKVKMLRQMIISFQDGNLEAQRSIENNAEFQLDVRTGSGTATSGLTNNPQPVFLMNAEKVKPFTFPVYIPADTKDDIATDELGEVDTMSTLIEVKKGVSFHDLKVPRQYKICGYNSDDVHDASRSYVSPVLARPLRSGAEDEVIELAVPPHLLKMKADDKTPAQSPLSDTALEKRTHSSPDISSTQSVKQSTSSGLMMPSALLSNPPYHPLHIFNPFPGMQRTYLPFTHSEVDPDFHLCPMPRYTMLPGAQSYLDKDDTIKGIMAWKSFPPQALVSLSQSTAQQEVALPRWSDPFSEAMVPVVTPVLLKPSQGEASNVVEDPDFQINDSDAIELTPEMVQAEFQVSESEVVAAAAAEEDDREQKQVEVQASKSGYDQLGTKIRATLRKLENMDKKMPKITYC